MDVPTNEELECIVAGEAAQAVVKKFYVQLCGAITTGDVLPRLYAYSLIDQIAFEHYVEPGTGLTTTEKGRLIVLKVQRSVSCGFDEFGESGIRKLCEVLREEKDEILTKLAEAIEAQMTERVELEKLRMQLKAFNITSQKQLADPPSLTKIIKRILQNYIEESCTIVNPKIIQEQLKELYDESLISSQLYTWALGEFNRSNGNQSDVPSAYPFISVEQVSSQVLGDSPHGRVQVVIDKKGDKYAAKIFLRAYCKEFVSEFRLLALLRHKNIVRYIGLAEFDPHENPAVVMELMDIDLHNRILKQPPITFSDKVSVLRDVAEGLHYLHSHRPMIIHRDLTAKIFYLVQLVLQK